MGGTYVDCIETGIITAVVWNGVARWQAAIGNMFIWLSYSSTNTYATSQIYDHLSNFHIGGSFTAAGTGAYQSSHGHYNLEQPWKLGQRLYCNVNLAGTGPTDMVVTALIHVKS